MPPAKRATAKLGLRREATVFLPLAGLALVVLSVFAVVSHRNTLAILTEEARGSVLDRAWETASQLSPADFDAIRLRRALGPGLSAALVGPDGSARVAVGDLAEGDLLRPLSSAPSEALTSGPSGETGGRVVAWIPLRSGLTLRVEERRETLAAEWTRWRRLAAVVAFSVTALGTLLLLYLRRLFAPIDDLLRTARELDPEGPGEGDDEIEYLVQRFERAMAALRERRSPDRLTDDARTLEQTFSRLESGMALISLDGELLALNRVGARLLDIPDPALPASLEDLLGHQPEVLSTLHDSMNSGRALRRDECRVHSEGEERILGMTSSLLDRDDGTPRGWILLFADLTGVRAEARRRQLSASLDQLAELSAGLAHELRNSLASIQGFAALLRRADLDDTADADARELQREIDQLHRLVEDFLSFARPGAVATEEVDLHRLAHRAAGDPALQGAPVRVRAGRASSAQKRPDWLVSGDAQLLHRLLRNLLLNAVRAQAETDPAEPVEVTLGEERDGAVVLAVADRGPGLSPSARSNLFVPFSSDSKGGTGLGLALARRIADLHHAELTVEDREGGGALARIRFPTGGSRRDEDSRTSDLPLV